MKRKLKFLMALLLFGGSLVSAQQSFFVSEVATNTCNSIFIRALVQKTVIIDKDLQTHFGQQAYFYLSRYTRMYVRI